MENLFEFATRKKLTFPYRGQVSVEDLWDLRPEQLNEVFQTVQSQRKGNAESLIAKETEADVLLGIQADIVRHIFETKQAEAEAKEREVVRREEKRRLQEILARKREEGLNNLSEAEILAMIESL